MSGSLNLKISELVEKRLKYYNVPVKDNDVKGSKQTRKYTEQKNEQVLALLKTLVTGNIDEAVEQVFEEYHDEVHQFYEPNVVNTVRKQKKDLLTSISEQLVTKNVKENMSLLNRLDQNKNSYHQVQPELLDIDFLYAKHQFFTRYGKLIQEKLQREQDKKFEKSLEENQKDHENQRRHDNIDQSPSQSLLPHNGTNETDKLDEQVGLDEQNGHKPGNLQFKKDMHTYNLKFSPD